MTPRREHVAPGSEHDDSSESLGSGQRIDKWLWYTRLVKSRTLAGALVSAGKVRINRVKVAKPSATVSPGAVVTIAAGQRVRVVRVLAAGTRRGPASEAQALYDDLTAPTEPTSPGGADAVTEATGEGRSTVPTAAAPQREAGTGRPTKRERRHFDRLRGRDDET